MTPDWIQAITSILTFLAAVAAGLYARRAAIYTKQQAGASDRQVQIAKDALAVTKGQAAAAEAHSEQQVELARENLEIARKEIQAAQVAAERQAEEAQASYRSYEESKLDAAIPVILATVKRPGWFLETKEIWEDGQWPPTWETFTRARYFEEGQNLAVVFRIRLNVTLENVSDHIARVDIVDTAHGEVDVRGGVSIIVPPRQERTFTWTRTFTPVTLASEDEINDIKNWLFNLTLWVRDLGMNVRDTYKFNSDLRLFSRDGSRLLVRAEPEHNWTENVAQPLQQRVYERLETSHSGAMQLNATGSLTTDN